MKNEPETKSIWGFTDYDYVPMRGPSIILVLVERTSSYLIASNITSLSVTLILNLWSLKVKNDGTYFSMKFTITGVLNITHGRLICSDVHLLYKHHFLDGFRLRLRDLMEPNTLLPKSLSDRERWRGIRGGGDGEKEGEERGEREWQLPSRLWEQERLKRLAVEDRRLSSPFVLSNLTPSSLLTYKPPCPTSNEETQCARFVGSSLWVRGTSKPWDSLLNKALRESLRLELHLSPSSLALFFENMGELSIFGLLSLLLDEAFNLRCSLLQLPMLFLLQPYPYSALSISSLSDSLPQRRPSKPLQSLLDVFLGVWATDCSCSSPQMEL